MRPLFESYNSVLLFFYMVLSNITVKKIPNFLISIIPSLLFVWKKKLKKCLKRLINQLYVPFSLSIFSPKRLLNFHVQWTRQKWPYQTVSATRWFRSTAIWHFSLPDYIKRSFPHHGICFRPFHNSVPHFLSMTISFRSASSSTLPLSHRIHAFSFWNLQPPPSLSPSPSLSQQTPLSLSNHFPRMFFPLSLRLRHSPGTLLFISLFSKFDCLNSLI